MSKDLSERLKEAVRQVPDFPKQGINFYDITTALNNASLFREIIETLSQRYGREEIDAVVGIEARGFILGGALAFALGASFVPVRKIGKLPAQTLKVSYDLEYGTDSLEVHLDALNNEARVLLVDDLLATGGTARSAVSLCEQLGAKVVECVFLIELGFLNGRQQLSPSPVHTLLSV